jgi:hypothetical protein
MQDDRRIGTEAADSEGTADMEHLWSQAGATGGNRSQMRHSRKRLK